MELSYERAKKKPRAFLALTGLTVEEFEKLLKYFEKAWEEYVEKNYVEREGRERKYGGGRKAKLGTIEEKLFFILYYLKTYPLQEVIAMEFGLSQSQACEWIHRLSEVLKRALEEMKELPEREGKELAKRLEGEQEEVYGIDGTERRVKRPKDPEKQKKYYSGKKKGHTVKNNVVGGLESRKVKYLGDTHEGKKHDKKIADEEEVTFPEGSRLYKDTGFQGYEPEGVNTKQPKKKPRKKELTEEEKETNREISRVRIVVEHIIGGVKISRIVKETYRNLKEKYEDLVMELACGLHNFRRACRAET